MRIQSIGISVNQIQFLRHAAGFVVRRIRLVPTKSLLQVRHFSILMSLYAGLGGRLLKQMLTEWLKDFGLFFQDF